jgi:hypothetical protein
VFYLILKLVLRLNTVTEAALSEVEHWKGGSAIRGATLLERPHCEKVVL